MVQLWDSPLSMLLLISLVLVLMHHRPSETEISVRTGAGPHVIVDTSIE
jgi:hypothetical protein